MSYIEDPVFQIVQQIRTPSAVDEILSHVWSRWAGKQSRVVQVKPDLTNYKPFERARIMAEATVVSEGDNAPAVTLNLFFHVFAQAGTARQEAESGYKQNFLPCEGPPVFLIPHWQTVVWTLPNAPNLAELAQLLNPEKFCRLLPADLQPGVDYYPAPKLVRYVPLKRALFTWENPRTHHRYFAKLCNDTDASRVVRNFQQINEVSKRGELGFAVPQLVSYNPVFRTLLMTEVSGSPFTETMRRVPLEPFTQMGRILAQLHSCDLHLETVWTPDKELAVLRRHMKGVRLALPQLGTPLDSTIARLEDLSGRLPSPQNQPIHGNLFGDQILSGPNGIGIVDWDALSFGDPLYDIGRLVAHLLYLAGREEISPTAVSACTEALLRSYEQEAGQSVNRQCLAWHVATQLLLRGKISSLRKLPEGWQAHLAFVIAEAEAVLNGRSRYLSLPALKPGILSEV